MYVAKAKKIKKIAKFWSVTFVDNTELGMPKPHPVYSGLYF
jgi:hypothetical protein